MWGYGDVPWGRIPRVVWSGNPVVVKTKTPVGAIMYDVIV